MLNIVTTWVLEWSSLFVFIAKTQTKFFDYKSALHSHNGITYFFNSYRKHIGIHIRYTYIAINRKRGWAVLCPTETRNMAKHGILKGKYFRIIYL